MRIIIGTVLLIVSVFNPSAGALGDKACTDQGGTCVDWRYYVCNAGIETGLCSGDSNIRCCLDCDLQCQRDENGYESSDNCDGNCQDNSNYCSGTYLSGMCGGPSSRKCCSSNSGGGGIGGGIGGGGQCTLKTYSTSYIKGYGGLEVKVEPGFESSMDMLNTYARQCDITVWVTHAYREEGQNLGGTVVPPASNSNHLVGHAIDFNVETANGAWCNGDCLYAGNNADAECFIQKVMNSGLRWGGVWNPSDPVHIDDGLNVYDQSEWNSLYYDLQAACN